MSSAGSDYIGPSNHIGMHVLYADRPLKCDELKDYTRSQALPLSLSSLSLSLSLSHTHTHTHVDSAKA